MLMPDICLLVGYPCEFICLNGALSGALLRLAPFHDPPLPTQELANPAANLSAAASYEEVMRLLRMPSLADKDKVRRGQ